MKDKNVVKSVVKAMKVFEELAYHGSPLSLSRLSQRVNINISTVHRSIIITHNFDLRNLVHPYMEEIQASCNETTNLVVLENNQVVYLDQVESTQMVRMFASIGSKGPAYCTGSGKILLSYLNQKQLEEYIKEIDFIKYTENTIIEPEKLKEELVKIREQGYALDFEEMEKGVCCVAAPVIGREGRVLAAISVSGPRTRINKDYMNQILIPLVKEKAEEISRRMKG